MTQLEESEDLRHNIAFLARVRVFSQQIKEMVTKIVHLDYDAMANLVSEFEELKQKDLAAFVLGRSKNSRPLLEKA